jgi:hypothetical protein
VVELVDTLALGASGETREGSSPFSPTTYVAMEKKEIILNPSESVVSTPEDTRITISACAKRVAEISIERAAKLEAVAGQKDRVESTVSLMLDRMNMLASGINTDTDGETLASFEVYVLDNTASFEQSIKLDFIVEDNDKLSQIVDRYWKGIKGNMISRGIFDEEKTKDQLVDTINTPTEE